MSNVKFIDSQSFQSLYQLLLVVLKKCNDQINMRAILKADSDFIKKVILHYIFGHLRERWTKTTIV